MPENVETETPVVVNHTINYIELPVTDMAASKAFYTAAFGWSYVDYGPTYAAFTNTGLDGGFDAASDRKPSKNGALVVIYAEDLEASLAKVKAAGGEISIPIFSFPGGRRFHFVDPSGNELSVASYAQE
ncbi:MAG: glyoxalase family protein [Robiginitomaculum sp.]|nr:MAG: glyoxalase family protein [Robiginitomaculum sp.]